MNLRKNVLLLPVLLSMAITAFSDPVDRETARQQADAFAHRMGRQVSKQKTARAHQAPAVGDQRVTPYYVYDIDDEQGFIIVAGDDRAVPILGYTDSGHFDADQIPDNMKAWLNDYAQAIAALDASAATNEITAGESDNKAAVEPLMKSQWNQSDPYNNKCPVINGLRCPTGCVATAMSQIMYYYRWPQQATTSIPAYSWDDGAHSLSELPPVTFDWNGMQDTYNGNVNGDAVSTLMQYAGQALRMGYSPVSSGALSLDVYKALSVYFDYDQNMRFINRDGFSIATWENLVYQEIAEGRPVYYSGASFGGGHAFVADGYDGNGLFHINWGWGGWCDGYFRLSVLNPDDHSGIGAGTSSDGFCMGQQIVIGIQPPTGQPKKDYCQLYFSRLEVKRGATIVYDVWNSYSYEEAVFDIGIGAIDDNGNVLNVYNQWTTASLPNGYGYMDIEAKMSGLLDPGTYKLVPVCRKHGDREWLIGSELRYVTATVSANRTITLTCHPEANFDVTKISFPGTHIVSTEQQVNVQIENYGDEVNEELYLFAYHNGEGEPVVLGRTALYLPKDGKETLKFFFTPNAEGLYNVEIALDENCAEVIGSATVNIMGYKLTQDLTTVPAKLVASHPGVVAEESPEKAIDDELSTKYCANVPVGSKAYLRYELDRPIRLTSYSISSANDAPERDPYEWRLQGSNDGSHWCTIDKRKEEIFENRFETHEYTVDTKDSYLYYRFYLDERRDRNAYIFQIAEWQLMGVDPETEIVVSVQAKEADNSLVYTIDGRPANRQTLKPGVYVNKGKKVIINAPSR